MPAIEAKLAEIRQANGGKPPNILFVLIDDVGFGEMGDPVLNQVRGNSTPNINAFARESLAIQVKLQRLPRSATRINFHTLRIKRAAGIERY